MLKIKPPTHTVDGLAVFISMTDPAWDFERLAAERDAQVARALAEKQDAYTYPADPEQAALVRATLALSPAEQSAAVARAPVERYYAGKSRFQLDAPDWAADGSPSTARAFLKAGEKPAEFGLRRLGFRAHQEVAEIENARGRLLEACRLGLRSIKAEGYTWKAPGDEPAGDEQLEALHAANPWLLDEIGASVLMLGRPLDHEAETPR